MTETARALLTAAVLSGSAFAVFAYRVRQADPMSPDRLVGELRLAQWAAILLAATGAVPLGLAVSPASGALGAVEVAIGVGFVVIAAAILLRDPRSALVTSASAFIAHALVDIAHRPGWLAPDLAPRWFIVASAIYDVCIAAVCLWAQRR